MDYSEIIYEVDGASAVITLNRPERLNAWTATIDRELKDSLARAGADPAVVGIVLTGAGRGFCAGADMGNLNSISAAGGLTLDKVEIPSGIEANYHQRFSFLLQVRKPTIAAVNGPAAGVGMVAALYCDLRFASESARFGTAFSKLGLAAEHGFSWLLPRMIGIGNAMDLLYSARVIDATEALRMGLVQRVVAPERLLSEAKDYIEQLSVSVSPNALSVAKRLVWDAMFTDLASATESANHAMEGLSRHPDFREGLSAFQEKRAPAYGRLTY